MILSSKLNIRLVFAFILLALVGFWMLGSYNGLVRAKESLDATWAQVETQYQRRFDLIPNLQAAVAGAADFEKSTFTAVTEARTKWMRADTQTDQINAINNFDSALSRLLVTVENFPNLKATEAFRDFAIQLEGTENRVAVARRDYNEEVKKYNISIKTFPTNLLAGFYGFEPAAFFQSNPAANQSPKVEF